MNRKILLADNTIEDSELGSLAEWIKSGSRLTKGPMCQKFEREFADWQGAEHGVFVNSGSSANLLIAQSLLEGGYLKNKKVIAPAVSWVTTLTPFMQLNCEVHLCDCDKKDLGYDLTHFEDLCRKHNPAVAILVHVLGHSNKLKEILEICQKYDVLLIEDSCEALGSIYQGKKLGSMGKAGSFSFYYGHHISTIEGGMVVTDDENFYNLMLSVRSHGWGRDVQESYQQEWRQEYDIDEVRDLYTFYHSGFNLRSTDLNAYLGISQMKKLDVICEKREKNYKLYSNLLSDFWGQKSDGEFISSFAYGTLVANRLEVFKHLKNHGIETRPLICGNLGLHPFWIKKYGKCNFPHADVIHENGLYLPNHFNLTESDISYVCDRFKEVAQEMSF